MNACSVIPLDAPCAADFSSADGTSLTAKNRSKWAIAEVVPENVSTRAAFEKTPRTHLLASSFLVRVEVRAVQTRFASTRNADVELREDGAGDLARRLEGGARKSPVVRRRSFEMDAFGE